MAEIDETNAVLHEFIEAYDGIRDHTFFVQIGANDGRHDDPLNPFVERSRWRGVLVEPVPYVFKRLTHTYAHRPDLILVNAAVSSREGSATFYYLEETTDALPVWYDQVGSFMLETILDTWSERMIPDLRERIRETEVNCLTFTTLCERSDVARVDVIHMDTEGHDYEILKSIDLVRYRPELVIYEHKHLDSTHRAAADAMMREYGYATAEIGYDTLCVQQAALAAAEADLGPAWHQALNAPSWYE
ncbi:FkbM family methyltransferase [Streptomyces sp. BE230]|uniref:FkbM family methyltransferase n=1 Tax=Streptomyces sp. BE230 TaxID=3002526 RepID=UPI002ED28C7B|nr:FkbM family methyltransferase [Streptomyces sp. BE230]